MTKRQLFIQITVLMNWQKVIPINLVSFCLYGCNICPMSPTPCSKDLAGLFICMFPFYDQDLVGLSINASPLSLEGSMQRSALVLNKKSICTKPDMSIYIDCIVFISYNILQISKSLDNFLAI